jgi:hypothetical protein
MWRELGCLAGTIALTLIGAVPLAAQPVRRTSDIQRLRGWSGAPVPGALPFRPSRY